MTCEVTSEKNFPQIHIQAIVYRCSRYKKTTIAAAGDKVPHLSVRRRKSALKEA